MASHSRRWDVRDFIKLRPNKFLFTLAVGETSSCPHSLPHCSRAMILANFYDGENQLEMFYTVRSVGNAWHQGGVHTRQSVHPKLIGISGG